MCFLAAEEIDALLAAPDRTSWLGRRDHALLLVAVQTGLRMSELTGLVCGDLHLGVGAHVRCRGKGPKDRATPLTAQTVDVVRVWLRQRAGERRQPLCGDRRAVPGAARRGTAAAANAP